MRQSITIRKGAWLFGLAAAGILVMGRPAYAQSGNSDDSVLRAMTSGMERFADGDWATARAFWEPAAEKVNAIWGSSSEAQQARSLWSEEKRKPFRGEAYERSMLFSYLGILDLGEGDYGNAQAAFRVAIQQDAFAEEEQYRADVLAPQYLLALALAGQGSGSASREILQELTRTRPDLGAWCFADSLPDILLIMETGTAPRKLSDGIDGERIRMRRGRGFPERFVTVQVDDNEERVLMPVEDVFWQARTRGGRPFDQLLEGKARFVAGASDAGRAFADLGDAYSLSSLGSGEESGTGNALAALGILAQGVALFGKPAADTRYWDNLPDVIHVLPMNVGVGRHDLRFRFTDENKLPLPGMEISASIDVLPNGLTPKVVWFSSQPRSSSYLHMHK